MQEEVVVDLQRDHLIHQIQEQVEQEELEVEEQVQLMQEQELQEQLIQVEVEETVVLLEDLHFLVDQAEPAVQESLS
jgi:hypothetical protein